jgi:hypothetical protein
MQNHVDKAVYVPESVWVPGMNSASVPSPSTPRESSSSEDPLVTLLKTFYADCYIHEGGDECAERFHNDLEPYSDEDIRKAIPTAVQSLQAEMPEETEIATYMKEDIEHEFLSYDN